MGRHRINSIFDTLSDAYFLYAYVLGDTKIPFAGKALAFRVRILAGVIAGFLLSYLYRAYLFIP
ncbi:MAG: hypothetical protein WKF91_22550, partial [Segetibacter sp.]